MQVPEPRKKSEKILKNHRTLTVSTSTLHYLSGQRTKYSPSSTFFEILPQPVDVYRLMAIFGHGVIPCHSTCRPLQVDGQFGCGITTCRPLQVHGKIRT